MKAGETNCLQPNHQVPMSTPGPNLRISVFWAAAMFISLLTVRTEADAESSGITIDPRAVLVEHFDGWGTSLCWWAHLAGGYTNREEYADLAFKQLRLNIVRYNIGGGENPRIRSSLELRARVPGFQPEPGKWDWQADANQRWMLRAAVARGANHIVAFANSPPYWMTVSGSVTGSTNGWDNNLRSDCEKDFADYIATVVSNLTVLDGVKFDSVTPMNEPSAGWWKFGGRQEGAHMSPDQQARMIGLLHAALERSGVAAGMAASEDNDEQSTWRCLTSYNAATRGQISHFATHTYKANDSARLRDLAQAAHKPLWVSEYGDGERSGLTLARRIRDDIAVKHASAWIYWQFADFAGWGLVDNPLNGRDSAYRLTRKFHVMAQFSRFIRPGFQILQASDDNSLAACDVTNHQLIIVTVNDSFEPRTSVFDLSGFTSTGAQALGHRTSAGENVAALAPVPIQAGHFTAGIPARSITTFVIPETFSKPIAR